MSKLNVNRKVQKPVKPSPARRKTLKSPRSGKLVKHGPVHHMISRMASPLDQKSDGVKLEVIDERKRKKLDTSSENSPLAYSLVDPLQVYRCRLGGYSALQQNAGATINTFLPADPSAAGWNSPEWAFYVGLFSEFKLVELRCQIVRNFGGTSPLPAGGVGSLLVCSNLGTAAAPGSYAAGADNADSVLLNFANADIKGYTHVMRATQLAWSEVVTPTVAPYAGAPGSIQFFSTTTAGAGAVVDAWQLIVSGIYDFRIRV